MTKFIKDISPIKEDIDFLLKNDVRLSKFEIQQNDILWPVFETGFEGLVRILQGQQISFKGANTMWRNLKNNFGVINIKTIRNLSEKDLKSYGFSKQKQTYLDHLIETVQNNELFFDEMENQSNDGVLNAITSIKGFGNWSAQAYLLLCLNRSNIILQKDLVVDQALMNLLKLEERPTSGQVSELCKAWEGRESAAMLILWHLKIYHFRG